MNTQLFLFPKTVSFYLGILLALAQQIQAQSPIHHWETVVIAEQNWHYFLGNSEPDANWRFPDYETAGDTTWQNGIGGLGYGDEDDASIIPPVNALYLRTTFSIVDTSQILAAVLNADYDDAFVAYLNGQEIARANIGVQGDIPSFDAETTYFTEARLYRNARPENFMLTKSELNAHLQPGENTLAIQVHNDGIASSDLSAIFYLSLGIKNDSITYNLNPEWFLPPVILESSNLPILKINTNGGVIVDEPRITAQMQVLNNWTSNRNYINDTPSDYNGQIAIEIRGSSSQTRFPKKSYALETQNADGSNNNTTLLGLPSENDWILYGPYSDKSLMRNVLLFELARSMGQYAPRTAFCELVINNKYQGLYVLMEKIKVDKNRVNIAKMDLDDVEGDGLTGGYMLKIDKKTGSGGDGWYSQFAPTTNPEKQIFFQYEYPEFEEMATEQVEYIQNYIHEFEQALYNETFATNTSTYQQYIEVAAFIDFWLANEISYNVDGMRMSTFMYKERDSDGGKLKMGPAWDFNLSLGNGYDCNSQNQYGFLKDFNVVCPNSSRHIPFWWNKLLEDPSYTKQVRCTWENYRANFLATNKILNQVNEIAQYLEEAQARNFNKWPIINIKTWPNTFEASTYDAEITQLQNWIDTRLTWLDENLPGECTIFSNIDTTQLQSVVYPNPASTSVTMEYYLPENTYVNLQLLNPLGQVIAMPINNEIQTFGLHKFKLEVQHLNTGIYFIKFKAVNQVQVIRICIVDN